MECIAARAQPATTHCRARKDRRAGPHGVVIAAEARAWQEEQIARVKGGGGSQRGPRQTGCGAALRNCARGRCSGGQRRRRRASGASSRLTARCRVAFHGVVADRARGPRRDSASGGVTPTGMPCAGTVPCALLPLSGRGPFCSTAVWSHAEVTTHTFLFLLLHFRWQPRSGLMLTFLAPFTCFQAPANTAEPSLQPRDRELRSL